MAGTIFDKLDHPRKYRFDLGASMVAENALGDIGLHEALQRLSGPRLYIILLWAGLSRDDQSLTINETRKLVQRAFRDKKLTMIELQRFILEQLKGSDAFSGIDFDDEEAESEEKEAPLASPDCSESD